MGNELSSCLLCHRRAQPRELVELWMSGDNSRAVGALSRGAGDMPDPFGVVRWLSTKDPPPLPPPPLPPHLRLHLHLHLHLRLRLRLHLNLHLHRCSR